MFEIERKFFIKDLPNVDNIPEVKYERHFLEINPEKEIRIQKKAYVYEKEVKTRINSLKYEKVKTMITQSEFTELKKQSIGEIQRSSYLLSKNPEISLKVYTGKFEGLNRVEVEFEHELEAENFIPKSWYGKEITGTELANDSKLVNLSDNEFQKKMEEMAKKKK